MNVKIFEGTRGHSKEFESHVMFSKTIMSPSTSFGGLYVPMEIPYLGEQFLQDRLKSRYVDLAYYILKSFNVDLGNNAIFRALKSYESFDNPNNPVPVQSLGEDIFVSELWHGPTRAFKDMALQPFPQLVSDIAHNSGEKYLVLAATSGDTGPAALQGFKNLRNTKVVCLYPDGGTSRVQKDQMVKAQGDNLKVFGIKGNFDDAQSALKKMIASKKFQKKLHQKDYKLSAANSVNFGRIIFQIVYHFWSYFELVRSEKIQLGEEVISIIPSGNFGNGLAAFYAKQMGLPLKKIILASNRNNVLTDFVKKGEYDLRKRKLHKTSSPAMDILKSSNIERLLYHFFGTKRTKKLMKSLEKDKYFILSSDEKKQIAQVFGAGYATDKSVSITIKDIFEQYGYICDPHTATAFVVRDKLKISDKTLIFSTAEWTKFSKTIGKSHGMDDDLDRLAHFFEVDLPDQIQQLNEMPEIHHDIIPTDQIEKYVLDFV